MEYLFDWAPALILILVLGAAWVLAQKWLRKQLRASKSLQILNLDVLEYLKDDDDSYVKRKYKELYDLHTFKVKRYLRVELKKRDYEDLDEIMEVVNSDDFEWTVEGDCLSFWTQPYGSDDDFVEPYELPAVDPTIIQLWEDLQTVQEFAKDHGVQYRLLEEFDE